MNDPLRVSVAMATYNGAQFLEEQLASLAGQSRPPDEVVITDDASTDATLKIAEDFARTAPFPIRIVRNPERLGYNLNFQAALLECTGDIIFVSDQDDVWFADKIETILQVFAENPSVMGTLNAQIITDGRLRHQNMTSFENARRLGIDTDRMVGGCASAIRIAWRDLLLPMPAETATLSDYDRWINELAVFLGVRRVVERPLQYWRRHDDNATHDISHNPAGTGVRDLIATRVAHAPIEAWRARRQVLQGYALWIAHNRQRLEALGLQEFDRALRTIEHESSSLERREAIYRRPSYRRLGAVLSLWRFGGYRHFHGWKSALRDLVRGT